ncbi:MAG TPA: MgtC/SapB family protein [Pseudonocardia sp.]|nr:MgtC/SapB family protein [Pseudonocardia sp.]
MEPFGQGWVQLAELGLALLLSAIIGFERELRQKSAGLRTHTLIGFGSALFMLVSKYGFTDVLGEHVVLDPSRVAAQIVSGIGFIGGGLIFVRRDLVRGLTTAAAVWLTTAIGMAAGAGLPVLAVASTAGYLIVVYALAWLGKAVSKLKPHQRLVEVWYEDGRGLLRTILSRCTAHGWVVEELSARGTGGLGVSGLMATRELSIAARDDDRLVSVSIRLYGTGDFEDVASELGELDGVLLVTQGGVDPDRDPETE